MHYCESKEDKKKIQKKIFDENLVIVVENMHAVDFYCLSNNYEGYKRRILPKTKSFNVYLSTRDCSADYIEEPEPPKNKTNSDESMGFLENSVHLPEVGQQHSFQTSSMPQKFRYDIDCSVSEIGGKSEEAKILTERNILPLGDEEVKELKRLNKNSAEIFKVIESNRDKIAQRIVTVDELENFNQLCEEFLAKANQAFKYL